MNGRRYNVAGGSGTQAASSRTSSVTAVTKAAAGSSGSESRCAEWANRAALRSGRNRAIGRIS